MILQENGRKTARQLWALPPDEVYRILDTPADGLSQEEAAARLESYGPNELPEPPRRSLVLRFADHLTHFMAVLLWVAGILAFVSHTPELGWAIWAVIWINAAFSFWQEYQAERALTALKQSLPEHARVYREGKVEVIPARELVPGDLYLLEEGDRVSADARLVAAETLYLDVSVLTGESMPVSRDSQVVDDPGLRPVEAHNVALAGASLTGGHGLAIVYATGAQTEFGRVAHLTATVERATSTLEIQVARIVRIITAIAVSMGVLVFLIGYLAIGMAVGVSFVFAIGIIVANVPEGLLPTVTLSLAMGVQRMARRNALVRRLSAVETLSATTVICSDKTGTLTKNEMTVRNAWIPGTTIEIDGNGYDPTGDVAFPIDGGAAQQARLLLAGAALCSNARLEQRNGAGGWQVIGDPTEGALLVAAQKAGVGSNQIGAMAPRIHELPFDSRRKMMSVVLRWSVPDLLPSPQSYVVFTKGAPLEVLRRSRHLLANGQLRCLSESDRAEVLAANDTFAGLGLRVLGIGFRTGGAELADDVPALLEQELTFVGLVAMLDPARPEVEGAIRQCRVAGISVTMITGDYGLTAEAIARRIGLVTETATIVKGDDLDTLSEESLRDLLVGSYTKSGLIFARVMPEQKLRLVQAYQGLGHIVAVTGDGVNDAPALRAANIGLAMGGSGTDVAREAAEIVLTDDNFATIVGAVEQGRAVYDNIRKFMTYILASNVPEIVPFLAMVAFGIPPALTILQILAVDLGTDMIPAMALGAEPPEKGVMERPPRPKDQPLLDVPLLLRAYAFLGVIEAVASMIAFLSVWQGYGYSFADLQSVTPAILARTADAATMLHYQQATTMALAAIVACQIGNVFACRAEVGSSFGRGLFSNRLIWIGVVTEISLLLAVVYLPPLQRVFDTAALTPLQWLSLLIWPPALVAAEELRKLVVRRWQRASR